ncbi:MAG: hypothetical protein UR27_C0005G0022 [Candidatus Peregrinibacteria bacterium GW2011_GWA2_33_10]|nr:MAG: hypothetical protein UR27_C0005G0022 [Candidatus Peregrinibacteria bacterium GW2011_GWA2_33_10]KKP39280.1 MAG: hypothetical protein UR30_C0011G0023 [Candidatus Peregrinibacteria bacterium GW2011_GWC2_33_13]OGJ49962.1 MAG: hypothetical protein A2229_01950 [Candidatus Peregrinibacteria bacterium RIFOXYA2_FULL_33_7]
MTTSTLQETAAETLNTTQQTNRTRCEVWTRVMGYHRPVSQFNLGKKSEHSQRTHFTECKTCKNSLFN